MPRVAIIGTTTWGITLGVALAVKRAEVGLWARTEDEAAGLKNSEFPSELFAGITMPSRLSITSSLEEALAEAKAVIMAVPSQSMRANIKTVAPHLESTMLIVNAAKGLELETHLRMSQVIAEEINPEFCANICVLSGPNLSQEILRDLPAAAVVAAHSEAVAKKAQKLLKTPNLCIYTNTDVIGVELGGALKNIIALGAGIVDGLGYGDNAKAAFITRGLTEITALGIALGANPLTFSGLTGLGDLVATCSSHLSRNHYVGVELTKERPLEEITGSMSGVAEGVTTTLVAYNLAQQLKLEMPITEKIYRVLYEGLSPKQAALELMEANVKHELVGRRWRLASFFKRGR
jgi:glycerol-3-phosphate dehydrogenase (NAD(P)+)